MRKCLLREAKEKEGDSLTISLDKAKKLFEWREKIVNNIYLDRKTSEIELKKRIGFIAFLFGLSIINIKKKWIK